MNIKSLVLFAAALVATSSIADLKSDTQKQFDRYCAAVKNMDGKGIEKVLRDNFAPNFEFIPKKGKSVPLSVWIADEKTQIAMTQSVKSVSLHIDSMKMGKDVATTKITLRYEGITKIDPKGKPGLLRYTATSDETMVKKNGKWWITEMKEDNSKSLFNGKLLGM